MVNYEIDPDALEPLLPASTELDFCDGATFVSTVGFLFLDTRVYGVPLPFHGCFEEVNLRFYVRRNAADGWRRGVAFIKEIVPRRAIAFSARRLFNENYVALPVSHSIDIAPGSPDTIGRARYAWRFRGQEYSLEVRPLAGPECIPAGSHEEFIARHYWGYAKQRDGGTLEYRVEHPDWRRIWSCRACPFEGDAAALYGAPFAEALRGEPRSAFLIEGSAVAVHRGRRIESDV
jgi:hypothetical protein